MEKDFNELLQEIRPYIIKGIQDAKVGEYEQIYKARNGKNPSVEEINQFISILIANGTVKSSADEIMRDLADKYNKKLIPPIVFNSIFTLASLNIFLVYILLYLKTNMNLEFVNEDYLMNTVNFGLAILLLVVTIISYIISISKKDKY